MYFVFSSTDMHVLVGIMATQEVTWCQRKKRNMREWSKIRAASQPRKVNQKRTLVSVCIQDSEMASRLVRQIPPPTVETYINQEKIRVTPPVRRCVKPFLHPSEQNSFQAMVFAQAMLPSPFRLWTCAERYLEINAIKRRAECEWLYVQDFPMCRRRVLLFYSSCNV
jgi:hypothetical protein